MKSQPNRVFPGRAVISERADTVDTPDGPVETHITTVEPFPQRIVPLTDDQLAGVAHDAAMVRDFIGSTGLVVEDHWTLQELDAAFKRWSRSSKARRVPEQAVIAIIGSAFGQYCADHLDMEWVEVQDADGSDYAVRSHVKEVMRFPYSAVQKRIEDREHSFLLPIFHAIEQAIGEQDHADRPTH